MDPRYHIGDTSEIITPAVVLFVELLEQNLDKMIEIAGDPARLRPHCKTHKMAEVIRRELRKGIVKHKCATFAEAEMLATFNMGIGMVVVVAARDAGRSIEHFGRFEIPAYEIGEIVEGEPGVEIV